MIAPLIFGLFSIGTAIGTGALNRKSQKSAQKENRAMYEQQLADEKKQSKIDNSIASKRLAMGDRDLSFQENMFSEKSKDTEDKIKYDLGKANMSAQKKASDKLFNPEENYLFKSRISGRYR